MSAVTANHFLDEYDRFAHMGLNPAKVQRILDRVEARYCPAERWGADQVEGIMLRTAHTIDLDYIQAGLLSAIAGNAAEGQAPPALPSSSDSDGSLRLTPYGRDFIELRDSLGTTSGFSFGGVDPRLAISMDVYYYENYQ